MSSRAGRRAFVEAEGIELAEKQLEGIAGGKVLGNVSVCRKNENGNHEWVRTGNMRPGIIFGDTWPDKEERCKRCGEARWVN